MHWGGGGQYCQFCTEGGGGGRTINSAMRGGGRTVNSALRGGGRNCHIGHICRVCHICTDTCTLTCSQATPILLYTAPGNVNGSFQAIPCLYTLPAPALSLNWQPCISHFSLISDLLISGYPDVQSPDPLISGLPDVLWIA